MRNPTLKQHKDELFDVVNARYQSLLTHEDLILMSLDAHNYTLRSYSVYTEEYFKQFYQIELKEGIHIDEVFTHHQDNLPFWLSVFEKVKQRGEYSTTIISRVSNHKFKVTLKPIYINDEMVEIGLLFNDLSQVMMYELKNDEDNEKFRALMEHTSDYVFMVDVPSFKIIYRNPASMQFIKRSYQISDEEIKEESQHLSQQGRDFWLRIYQEVIDKKVLQFRRQSFVGEAILDYTVRLVQLHEKQIIIALAKDVTKSVLFEQELIETSQRMKEQLNRSIQAISKIGELRDLYTAGHQQRVDQLALAIAKKMKLSDEQCEIIHIGSIIHDIGKIYIPAEILSKPSELSEHEYGIVKTHPLNGYDIIKDIGLPKEVSLMVLQHHERLDGSGYPYGLKAEDIILESRILAVADVVEAIASHRPYRPALGMEVALAEIRMHQGVKFDTDVVEACIEVVITDQFRFK